jgi:chemotaxis signal transduction protein
MSGGVVFRAAGELHFLPANVAIKLIPTPEIARVPGAPPDLVGVALVDGETLPVVAVGELPRTRGAMLVVSHVGERIALVGLEVLATGRFEGDRDQITFGDHIARPFDVGALVARVRDGRWQV